MGWNTIGAQPSALGNKVPLTLGHRLEALGSSVVGHALDADRGGEKSGKPVRAAQYVRMSTEHQKYSTENQSEALRQYASQRGMEIVRTYADEGKSGLRLDGRNALKQPHGTAPAPSGSRTRSRRSASGSSAPDRSKDDPSSYSTLRVPYEPTMIEYRRYRADKVIVRHYLIKAK